MPSLSSCSGLSQCLTFPSDPVPQCPSQLWPMGSGGTSASLARGWGLASSVPPVLWIAPPSTLLFYCSVFWLAFLASKSMGYNHAKKSPNLPPSQILPYALPSPSSPSEPDPAGLAHGQAKLVPKAPAKNSTMNTVIGTGSPFQ